MKKILTILTVCFCFMSAVAQTAEQSRRIQEIKDQADRYIYGQSTSYISYAEAFEAALTDLSRQISSSVDVTIKETNDQYDIKSVIQSAATFNDVSKIEFTRDINDNITYTVFVYLTKAQYLKQLQTARERAADRVRALIEEGKLQEGRVNIADAIKCFYWALHLAKKYDYNSSLAITDNRDLQMWLDDKIKSILQSVEVSLSQEKIEYDEKEYDRYIVNLDLKYGGRKVSDMDILYFNGEQNYQVAAKSGQATLRFPSLAGKNDVNFRIKYSYDDPDMMPEDIAFAFAHTKKTSYDKFNTKKVPVKISKDNTCIKQSGHQEAVDYMISEMSETIPAIVDEPYVEETRKFLDGANEAYDLLLIANDIEQALRSYKYDSVNKYFEPEALRKFKMMTNTGKISVVKTPSYTFEPTTYYIRVGFIPVVVKNGNHSRNENIVLRFDPQTRLVSSIAYALTENAENDIFRSADWNMESRYAILKFMEDYQTAYTTKDYDYIDKIFNGDAIIITGTIKPGSRKNYMKALETNNVPLLLDGVTYQRFDKDSYMDRLKQQFHDKAYIHLVYYDAVLTKAATPPMLSEAFWIQLKQDFCSSNYNDTGYLTLQIGVKPSGAQIYVRTWTPNQVSLPEMKRLFPFID